MRRLMTALLLTVATALMLVGCDASSKFEDHSPVEFTISPVIAENKALTVTESSLGDISYEYKMTPNWDSTGMNAVVGEVSSWTTLTDATLGYASQGAWTINVQGKTASQKVVYQGSAEAYISAINNNVVVYVAYTPVAETYGIVKFDAIKLQDLAAPEYVNGTYSYGYSVKYTLTSVTTGTSRTAIALTGTPVLNGAEITNVSTWSGEEIVPADQYILSVQILKNSGNTVIGGTTRSINVYPVDDLTSSSSITEQMEKAVVSGSLDTSDFKQPSIQVSNSSYTAKVTGPEASSIYSANGIVFNASCTAKAEDGSTSDVTTGLTYQWYVGGVAIDANNSSVQGYTISNNGAKLTINGFSRPGFKDVSCVIKIQSGATIKYASSATTYLAAANN